MRKTPKLACGGMPALREAAIPRQHKKEILLADFMGQGLKVKATVADFDKALARYGVKL